MKHMILAATLVLGSLTAASAVAQVPAADTAPSQHGMHHDPHRQAVHLSKKLGLSPDQTARLEPILARHHEGVRALRQNAALTPDQRKVQMHDLNRTAREQMSAVLTPDQMQQWKELRRERHSHKDQAAPAPAGA